MQIRGGTAPDAASTARRARRRRSSPALIAVFVAAGLLALPGSAPAERPADPRVEIVAESPREVIEHWTERRMRAAEPLDLPRPPPVAASSAAAGLPSPLDHSPFDSHEVANPTAEPYRAHGKVFFEVGGQASVCSGTVVPSATDNLVLTAGHCVFDADGTDTYVENFLFVPAYRNGLRPFRTWAATALATTAGWQQENFNFDLGFATVAPVGGERIEDVVGARGLAFNRPRNLGYDAFGHPARAPFDGQRLWVCESSYSGDDASDPTGPAAIGIGCDMTPGSSGGGWVIGGGYVASLVSYGRLSRPDHLFGPYFGAGAKQLYAAVDGAAGTPPNLIPPVDGVPPETTIVSGPRSGTTITSRRPSFGFAASEGGARFQCRIEPAAFSPCGSPRTLGPLADGLHVFAVRAIDSAGNADPSPARRGFVVDTKLVEPRFAAKRKQPQRGRRIAVKVKAGAGEPVRGVARGAITVAGSKQRFKLDEVRKATRGGERGAYRLKPAGKRAGKQLKRLLGNGGKLRARVTVTLTDEAGHRASERLSVRLK